MALFSSNLSPFFDSVAVIRGQSVKCCAFPAEMADPLVDTALDADTLVSTILLRRVGEGAWNDPSNPPKIGDSLSIGEQSFAIISVNLFDTNFFTLKAKSI